MFEKASVSLTIHSDTLNFIKNTPRQIVIFSTLFPVFGYPDAYETLSIKVNKKIYCNDHTSLSLYVNWVIYLVKIFNYKSCTTLYLGESEGLLDPVDPLGFRGWSLTKFRHEASLDSRAWIKGEVKKIINAIIKQHFSLYNKMQLERRKSTTWMRWTLNFDTCLYHPLLQRLSWVWTTQVSDPTLLEERSIQSKSFPTTWMIYKHIKNEIPKQIKEGINKR